jgi:hypothetical protein
MTLIVEASTSAQPSTSAQAPARAAVALGLTLSGNERWPRAGARGLEEQALAFLATTPARDAMIIRRHAAAYEIRFLLTRPSPSELGSALLREFTGRMVRLAEAAGHVGLFGDGFFGLGVGVMAPPPKTMTVIQAGVERTPLQWRHAFDPEAF